MTPKLRSIPSLLALLLAAAATPAVAVEPGPSGPNARSVTQQEIQKSAQSNLLDFVRANRPQWLRTRGVGTAANPVAVYLDGQRVGGPEQLRGISTGITSGLRYVDGQEATTRWGSGHSNGAILVTTGPLSEELRDEWRPKAISAVVSA
ncbi:MAG TPA: hypothetical protein VFZ18_02345 [Longimicrobiaceae bacterium]